MSYDIHLLDPVTKETAEVPGHLMIGGTYKADYHPETGTFTPALNTEAHLNITYNYGSYYREIYEEGIRTIYGLSGADSIRILEKMIEHIRNTYQVNGVWISTKRTITIYYDENNQLIEDIIEILRAKGKCREKLILYLQQDIWNTPQVP